MRRSIDSPVEGADVGFNAMQPGRVKRGDLLYLVSALVILAALVAWALAS